MVRADAGVPEQERLRRRLDGGGGGGVGFLFYFVLRPCAVHVQGRKVVYGSPLKSPR